MSTPTFFILRGTMEFFSRLLLIIAMFSVGLYATWPQSKLAIQDPRILALVVFLALSVAIGFYKQTNSAPGGMYLSLSKAYAFVAGLVVVVGHALLSNALPSTTQVHLIVGFSAMGLGVVRLCYGIGAHTK